MSAPRPRSQSSGVQNRGLAIGDWQARELDHEPRSLSESQVIESPMAEFRDLAMTQFRNRKFSNYSIPHFNADAMGIRRY